MAKYIKRRYECGNYIEEERYTVPNAYVASENRVRVPRDKTKLSSEQQVERNWNKAEKDLRRKANLNFIHGVDLFVTITAKKKADLKTFTKMTKNFIDRLKYRYEVGKKKLKYIYCYGEHKRKNKEDEVGVHAHFMLSGMSIDDVIEIWEKDKNAGQINISKLRFDNRNGVGGLAGYFIRNVKERYKLMAERGEKTNTLNSRKYTSSQSLKKVVPSKPIYITRKEFKEYPTARKGFKVMDTVNVQTSFGMFQIIHIIKIANMRF